MKLDILGHVKSGHTKRLAITNCVKIEEHWSTLSDIIFESEREQINKIIEIILKIRMSLKGVKSEEFLQGKAYS